MIARRGFTLVELLVAIGVIAILASLVVAVSGGVLARGERSQVEAAFQTLDQAIVAFEETRGRPLAFNRNNAVNASTASNSDLARFADIDEVFAPAASYRPYLMPKVLEVLMGNPASAGIIATISSDLLRRDPSGVMNLRDPWGNQVEVVPPGRAASRGEVKDARERVRASMPTAPCDPLGTGVDLADRTVRTNAEVRYNMACLGRRWLFLSFGPDRADGKAFGAAAGTATASAWDDNVLSYEPGRLNP